MRRTANTIKAHYSPASFSWHVKLDDVEFEVRYIMINNKDARSHRLLYGCEIDYIWINDVLQIISWKSIKQEELWELYNPDQPKNLAKSVTVK